MKIVENYKKIQKNSEKKNKTIQLRNVIISLLSKIKETKKLEKQNYHRLRIVFDISFLKM